LRHPALPFLLLSVLAWAGCDAASEHAVPVVPYDGPGLSAEDAAEPDGLGGTSAWAAERSGHDVVLSRSVSCGDECGESTRVALRHVRDGALPTFVAAERREQHGPPEPRLRAHRIVPERAEIQDWNLEGVVSGRVVGGEGVVFWYDVSAAP